MSGNNFVGDGVSAHVRCETGGAFRVGNLPVHGQLELDIVFPALCCKMLFVVANIGVNQELTKSHMDFSVSSWV